MVKTAYCAYISPISSCSLVKKRFCLFVFCLFFGGVGGGGGGVVCVKSGEGGRLLLFFVFN